MAMSIDELRSYLLALGACEGGRAWVVQKAQSEADVIPEDLWEACEDSNYMLWLADQVGLDSDTLQKGVVAAIAKKIDLADPDQLLVMSDAEVRWPGHERLFYSLRSALSEGAWASFDFSNLPCDELRLHWPWSDIEQGLRAVCEPTAYPEWKSAQRLSEAVQAAIPEMSDDEECESVSQYVDYLPSDELLRVAVWLNRPYISEGFLRGEILRAGNLRARESQGYAVAMAFIEAMDQRDWTGTVPAGELDRLTSEFPALASSFEEAVIEAWGKKEAADGCK